MKMPTVLLLLAGAGAAVQTNPTMDDYEHYMQRTVAAHSDAEQLGTQVLSALVSNGSVVAAHTEHRDYVFFSVFRSDFGRQKYKSLGAFGQFYLLDHTTGGKRPTRG